MDSFAPRVSDFDALFANEDIDVLFACETKWKLWESGTFKQLKFDGSVIFMVTHSMVSGQRHG